MEGVVAQSSSSYPEARLLSVGFTLSSAEEVRLYSTSDCSINYPSQLMNPFLGLPVESGKCESCGTSEPGECEGHFGYIEFPTPIFHPHHVSEVKRILSKICLNCSSIKKQKVHILLLDPEIMEVVLLHLFEVEVVAMDNFYALLVAWAS
ncbi:hypothetical protein EJ110_NYTH05783 [Nymphaea thermarum]|nr:hypothetical protein EJ110_NYTH05783 [Nymphaea thermarum]